MTDKKPGEEKDKEKDGYIKADLKSVRLNTELSFDAYLYLELNQKYVMWIRSGKPFTAEHLEKCGRLGHDTIFIPVEQRTQFEEYLTAGLVQQVAPPARPENVFGYLNLKNDPRMRLGSVKFKEKREHQPGSTPPRLRVDKDFLNCIILATQQAFLEICDAKIQSRPPFRRGDKSIVPLNVEVASVVSLVSQTIRGSVGLCFPADTYLFTLGKVLGRKFDEVTPELCMGSGELMNLLFERARPELIALGYELERAIPIVVYGKNLSLPHLISDPGFSIVFDSPGGPFQFEVGVKTGG